MRFLVAETLDPDGAMHRWCTPDLLALGHEALPLPTQELAPLLGPDGLAAWILAVADAYRPDLVILCPPYDHVSRSTLERLRLTGTRTVGFAFDEPLFAAATGVPRHAALAAYDHLFVTAPEHATPPATWLRWAASPSAFAAHEPLPADWQALIQRSVVLVGRPYARRVELVYALAAAQLPVVVFGHGWGGPSLDDAPPAATGNAAHARGAPAPALGPPLSGPAMHFALTHAGAVLTTGDWESQPLPMVKYRLLEAAFCGAPQLVQASADLATYFGPDEVVSYTDTATAIAAARDLLADPPAARAMAARARSRALTEHTWAARLPELLAHVRTPAPGANGASEAADLASPAPATSVAAPAPPAYLSALALLAHDAERRDASPLARAAFLLWHSLAPNPTAAAGLARLDSLGPATASWSAEALALLAQDPRPSSGLYARLPTHVGPGLGQVGALDPSPELCAMRLAALLTAASPEALADADALVTSLQQTPDLLAATASLLVPEGPVESTPVWRRLFSAALMSRPLGHDYSEHHDRWRAALA